jgi:hypothetical protein
MLAQRVVAWRLPAQNTSFAGVWIAEHDGKPFLRIVIEASAKPAITIETADVRASESGEITEVNGPLAHVETVLAQSIEKGVLHLKARQDDGDVVDYEMRLGADGGASLQLLQPPGVKLFQLRRT